MMKLSIFIAIAIVNQTVVNALQSDHKIRFDNFVILDNPFWSLNAQ